MDDEECGSSLNATTALNFVDYREPGPRDLSKTFVSRDEVSSPVLDGVECFGPAGLEDSTLSTLGTSSSDTDGVSCGICEEIPIGRGKWVYNGILLAINQSTTGWYDKS